MLAHKEEGGRSPYESLIGYEHIGISTGLSNVNTCYDINRLGNAIEGLKDLNVEDNDTMLNYIITKECYKYRDRLVQMLEDIIN